MRKIKISLVVLLIFSIAVGIFIGLKSQKKAKAGTGDNLYGYAWSSNIGWISVNNCTPEGACSGSNYGVNIDPGTGNFTGYAWSDNIGWIDFDPAFDPSVDPPESSDTTVKMDLSTNKITGWAKAVNSTGNDYGWIKFDDYDTVDEEIKLASTSGKIKGYPWGGGPDKEAVIGWISTNGTTDAGEEYGLKVENAPPVATDTAKQAPDDSELCSASQSGFAEYKLSWVFKDEDDIINDYLKAYRIRFENASTGDSGIYEQTYSTKTFGDGMTIEAYPNLVINSDPSLSNANLKYGENYNWEVQVQDSSWEQATSSWVSGPKITVPWKYPKPVIKYEPPEPRVSKTVEFDGGDSEAYDDSLNKTTVDAWRWNIETATTTINKNGEIVDHTYTETGKYDVTLTVEDFRNNQCSTTETIAVQPKPEEWEEVLPQ